MEITLSSVVQSAASQIIKISQKSFYFCMNSVIRMKKYAFLFQIISRLCLYFIYFIYTYIYMGEPVLKANFKGGAE